MENQVAVITVGWQPARLISAGNVLMLTAKEPKVNSWLGKNEECLSRGSSICEGRNYARANTSPYSLLLPLARLKSVCNWQRFFKLFGI